MKFIFLLCCFFFYILEIFAADNNVETIYIKSTRLESTINETPYSVSIKTAQDIQQKGQYSLAKVLQDFPGTSVSNSGGIGQSSSFFIRGAKSEHTLVMIDGLEINEPMSTARGFDFSQLPVDNIEQIEVLRGSQGVLYGSDAIGGVVNVVTKEGQGKHTNIGVEAGSYGTNKTNLGFLGSEKDFHYVVTGSRYTTAGFSSADTKLGNAEPDGFRSTNGFLRLDKEVANNIHINFFAQAIDNYIENDRRGGAGGDDPNDTTKNFDFFSHIQSKSYFWNDHWENTNTISFVSYDRKNTNQPDLNDSTDLKEKYNSDVKKASTQNKISFNKNHNIVWGIEDKIEAGNFTSELNGTSTDFVKKQANLLSVYGQYRYQNDAWLTEFGMRNDWHDLFGGVQTYQVAPAYNITKNTRLRASIGTGFKAPSLYQLYSSYGNTQLLPEKSISIDTGIEQRLFDDGVQLEFTYFKSYFLHLIDYEVATQKYKNIGKAQAQGIEAIAKTKTSQLTDATLQFTWLTTEDKTTGLPLLRRPKQKWNFDFNFRPGLLLAGMQILFVGRRDDLDAISLVRKQMPSYSVTNVWTSYALTNKIKISMHVDNLWNHQYEEIDGYGTAGLSAYLGCSASL